MHSEETSEMQEETHILTVKGKLLREPSHVPENTFGYVRDELDKLFLKTMTLSSLFSIRQEKRRETNVSLASLSNKPSRDFESKNTARPL